MVPNTILQKVFYLKYGNETGTSFLVSIENKDFLITARHLFPDSLENNIPLEIEILKSNNWIKLNCHLLLHENKSIDIAVLDIHKTDIKNLNFDIGSKSYYLSQDCFFLGFPFGLKMDDDSGDINQGYPIPFVKKGVISAFITDNLGVTQIFLDGHNNPGFSGGPVVITDFANVTSQKMRIIAVVSAYLSEEKIIKTPIGNFENKENTGIVLAYAFDHVFEIIKRQKK